MFSLTVNPYRIVIYFVSFPVLVFLVSLAVV